jgi:hypothetical protein
MYFWIGLCLIAAFLIVKHPGFFPFSSKKYWGFVFQPWKVTTFFMAVIPMTLLAPYSGDPTWDYYDAIFMSVLTYITAPWSIGILFRFVRGQAKFLQFYVAMCLWFFSASWSYDGYIYLRDGIYPGTWWSNIVLSSALYIPAGLMWNLAWSQTSKAHFAFSTEGWYESSYHNRGFLKLILWMLPFVLLAVGLILPFAWDLLFN